jgi:hypothetical protein
MSPLNGGLYQNAEFLSSDGSRWRANGSRIDFKVPSSF